MNVHELKDKFSQLRSYNPEDVNELLDFARKAYVHDEIPLSAYRMIVRELEAQGATVPESYKESSVLEETR